MSLADAVVGPQIHVLVFDAAPEPLDEHVVPENALKRVKNGRLHLIPASDETGGHGTTGMTKFYNQQFEELLPTAPQRAK